MNGAPVDETAHVGDATRFTYLERLGARSAATGTVLCLGIDPDPDGLPAGFSRDVEGIEAFAGLILDAALPFAAAVKPNLSFFEAFGSAGWAALERLRARIPGDVPVIADAGGLVHRYPVHVPSSLMAPSRPPRSMRRALGPARPSGAAAARSRE